MIGNTFFFFFFCDIKNNYKMLKFMASCLIWDQSFVQKRTGSQSFLSLIPLQSFHFFSELPLPRGCSQLFRQLSTKHRFIGLKSCGVQNQLKPPFPIKLFFFSFKITKGILCNLLFIFSHNYKYSTINHSHTPWGPCTHYGSISQPEVWGPIWNYFR